MASTILHLPVVNDSGTPAAPVGDGTQLNAALFQQFEDNINEFFARSSKTIAGVVTFETLGTHAFSAAGSGTNVVTVRNTTAGTGNAAELSMGNDTGSRRAGMQLLSTTFTPSGSQLADGGVVFANGIGGLSISAGHASAQMRFHVAGASKMHIDNSGRVGIGTTVALDTEATLQVSGGSGSDDWTLTLHHLSSGSQKAGVNFRIDTADLWQLYVNNADANALLLDYLGTLKLRIAPSTGHITPGSNNAQTLGADSFRWSRAFVGSGNAGDPSISVGDEDTGLYGSAADELSVSTGGTQRMRWTSGGNCVLAGGQHLTPNGSAGNPAYSFSNATSTGLAVTTGPDVLNLMVGGASVGQITTTGIQTTVNLAGQFISVNGGALGTGNVRGGLLAANRNSSGSGAAAALQLQDRAGDNAALWVESGNLRISSPGSAPLENDSVSHTSGVVVGTQTSSRDVKTRIRRMRDVHAALSTVLDTPIYRWRYKKGRGIQGEEFIGIITDESPLFGMDRDAQHPHGRSLNVANAVGLLVAGMQAQQRTIDALAQQIAAKGRAA